MNHFQIFQNALEELFPALSVFSDISWDEITNEYIASHDERPQDVDDFVLGFPDFLQSKAAAEDCPPYLFELAYVELLERQVMSGENTVGEAPGLYLNPTLSFLNLEFDISLMLDEATKGNVQIIQRPHILCIFAHPKLGLHHVDITTPFLEILQLLEKEPVTARDNFRPEQQKTLAQLIKLGLVIEVTN